MLLYRKHWKCKHSRLLGGLKEPKESVPIDAAGKPSSSNPTVPSPTSPATSPPQDAFSDGQAIDETEHDLHSFHESCMSEKIWSTLSNINGGKCVSRADLESILDLIGYVSNGEATITSLQEWDKYQEQKLRGATHIVTPKYTKEIVIDRSDVVALEDRTVTATFYYEDMTHFLTSEFGNQEYQGHFVQHAQIVKDNNGNRCVPFTFLFWLV